MKVEEIRKAFLDFFASKGHKIFPSASLIPEEDPTVLFTSAGMNQFKSYFLGIRKDLKRAASCQKCLRTDDLEKVGKTASHHTFFEMLGNFSFGDYFKEEAILWAWEFITQILKLPSEKIWVSVYQDDEEAYQLWRNKVGFPEVKIIRLGGDKNFWPANAIEKGPDGPCGPCSEIFYDLGRDSGCGRADCNPGCDCGRFIEIWNLVFTQFNRREENGKGVLEPLPSKNIDTGMGLERIASVIQGVKTNFEIDIFVPIIEELLMLLGGSQTFKRAHLHAIADHIRAVTFAVSDGVFPSNEERGYVVRKIVRKAIWHGYSIGLNKLFLYKLVPVVINSMKSAYPELEKRRENIAQIVKAEEERFQKTLEVGMRKLNQLIENLRREGEEVIPGEKVFQLYDTYGFPYELTREIAQEQGLRIDLEGLESALRFQRERSKVKTQLKEEIFSRENELLKELPPTEFIGYDFLTAESEVLAILNFEMNKLIPEIKEEEEAVVVVSRTPFYGEAGGQVGDRGEISAQESKALVLDTQVREERILHFIKVIKGSIKIKQKISLKVDSKRRLDTARNHTATHILQAVLRKVLGEHIEQSGSYVAPEKLRFDFTHFKALSKDEIKWIEEMVNEYIIQNDEVRIKIVPFELAKREGALAFFREKYQDQVRMVEIDAYSKELCAGTHLNRTGEIGLFKIVSESSSGSGIRRIEALTGKKAWEWVKAQEELIDEVAFYLEVERDKILSQLKFILTTLRKQEKFIEKQLEEKLEGYSQKLIQKKEKLKGVSFISSKVDEESKLLGNLIDKIKERSTQNTVIVLYSTRNGKLTLLIGLTPDLVKQGLDARKLAQKTFKLIKGGGGGRADFVQAGGKEVSNISKVIKIIKKELKDRLK